MDLREGWELAPAAPGEPPEGWAPALVPGTVGQVIEGDLDDRDWWYRCRFRAAPEEAILCFEGLATLCAVRLNGELVGETANMHRAFSFPVVLEEDNELVLVFRSLTAALAGRRARPRWKTALLSEQKLRFVRTALIGRLGAWGPRVPPIGPWRAVRVLGEAPWCVAAGEARLRVSRAAGATLEILGQTLSISGDEVAIELPDAPPWWPHRLGEPTLVPWELRRGERSERGVVGFRSVRLEGTTLLVNDREIFCRGACWAGLPSDDTVCRVLETARDAGLDMIRIVGTGSYAGEAFYEACDRLGILVWQDLPFANMDYPFDDEGFLSEVEAELASELGRIGRHPSLAVICGGSEVEQQAAMLGLSRETWQGSEELASLCARELPSVPFVPSSPTGGPLPFHTREGFTHYWGVGAYRRPLADVRRAGVRFTSECLGFSNVPVEEFTPHLAPHHPDWKAGVPRDAGAGWDFEDVRDHYLGELFGVDPVGLRSVDPARYLALSRIVTGELMLRAFAEWRRPGSGCSGALVWWLRDLVPGAGWGVLDQAGRPKPAWWFLRRAWAARAVLMTDEGLDGIDIHVHNEADATLSGRVVLSTWRRGAEVARGEVAVALGPRSSATLSGDAVMDGFQDLACAYGFGPPKHSVVVAQLFVEDELVHQDLLFPCGMSLQEVDGALSGSVEVDGEDIVVTLACERLLQAVSVVARGWAPDDGCFHLVPGVDKRIRFRSLEEGRRFKARFTALNSEQALTLRGQAASC